MAVPLTDHNLLILGAGGHAKEVADAYMSQGGSLRGFLDDSPDTWGRSIIGIPVLGAISTWAEYAPIGLTLGIGSNVTRRQIVDRLGRPVASLWRNVIHLHAVVSTYATMGCDVFINTGAIVNVSCTIGSHVIINTSAGVGHDCVIGDYAHIAPGAHLAGGVSVGEGTLIGIGAVVKPGCRIGNWAVVGAGAVVVRDIPDGVTAKGVPARW